MCYNKSMKNIELPKSLIELSDIFKQNGKKLYIVGGYIRNALLGFCETDIDICGDVLCDEIKKMLKNSIFSVKLINEKLGTIHIKSKVSEEEFEYSPFRQEKYEAGGFHSPTSIKFIKDIKTDCLRRDFTCNAIYYDIQEQKILDFCSGVQDVLEHRIKTVNVPQKTFDDDGLRILRMVRLSCELDFNIDENTFLVAKEKISWLKDIKEERFNKEIISILFSDFKYDAIKNPYGPKKGFDLLNKLGAWGYIFREISFNIGVDEVNKRLQNPWFNVNEVIPSVHRLSVFVFNILKALKLEINEQNIEQVLGQNGLMINKQERTLQKKLLVALDKSFSIKNEEIPSFIQENGEIISRLLDLLRLFGIGENIRTSFKLFKQDGVPMEIKDLKVNGYDIMKNFPNIEKRDYAKIFNDILKECLLIPEMNTKENLLNFIRRKYIWLK